MLETIDVMFKGPYHANPCMSNAVHVQTLLDTTDEITLPNGDRVKRVNAYEAVKKAYEEGANTGSYPCPAFR